MFSKIKSTAFGDKIISRLLIAYPKLNSLVDPLILQANSENENNNNVIITNSNNKEINAEKQEMNSKDYPSQQLKEYPNQQPQHLHQQSNNSNVNQSNNNSRNVKYGYPQTKYKFK